MEISQLDATSPKKSFPVRKQNAEGLGVGTRRAKSSSNLVHTLHTHSSTSVTFPNMLSASVWFLLRSQVSQVIDNELASQWQPTSQPQDLPIVRILLI